MIETYIVTKNDIILRVYHTTQGLEGIKKSLKFENVNDYDEIKKVTNEFEGYTGLNINEINENGKLKPLEQRIIEGYVALPKGFKIVDNKLVEKTLKEKIDDGDIVLSENEIYDEKQNIIRPKTPEEMYSPEELEKMRLEQMIQEEMQRIIRQQAIDNLVKAGKIVADELQKIVELENGDEDTKLPEQ